MTSLFFFKTVEDTVKAIVNEYVHNNNVTFGEFIASVYIEGASIEDVLEIYNRAKKEIDGEELGSLNVRVAGGYLAATASPDPNYPGIDIEFVANNDKGEYASRPRVLFEQPIDSDEVRVLVWGNKNSEDYTDEINFK